MAFAKPSSIALLAASFFGFPAIAAETWEGTWTDSPDPRTCTQERGDGTPLVVISREVTPGLYQQSGPDGRDQPKGDKGQIIFQREADPWICYIQKITNVASLDAWIFDLECGGEGEIWRDRVVFMRTETPDGIAAYNLGLGTGDINQLYRCNATNQSTYSVEKDLLFSDLRDFIPINPPRELTSHDKERLAGFGQSRLSAMAEATKDTTIVYYDLLRFMNQSLTVSETRLTGNWKCRSYYVGGILPLTRYDWFNCVIKEDDRTLILEKTSGSILMNGRLVKMSNGGYIYYGVYYSPVAPRQPYSTNASYDQVGILFALDDGRLRLELPTPSAYNSAHHEVIELRR